MRLAVGPGPRFPHATRTEQNGPAMHFVSLFFILTMLGFLPAYHALKRSNTDACKVLLLAYSYFFYGVWHVGFLGLLMLTTLLDYCVARALGRFGGHKKLIVSTSIATNLLVLSVFKYHGLLASGYSLLVSGLGFAAPDLGFDVALPVGISFYTFHSINYTIDVYRGKIAPEKSLLDVALFIAFFPQLVAGPILRATDFLPQIKAFGRLHADRP